MARPSATRCFWPPESCPGLRPQQRADVERLGGLGDVLGDGLARRARAGQRAHPSHGQALPDIHAAHRERQADILGHRHVRIERVALEHHGDVAVAGRQFVDPPVADDDRARIVALQPATMRSRVDLPQPDGPSSVRNSPSAISSEMSFRTSTAPKLLRTPLDGNCRHATVAPHSFGSRLSRFLLQPLCADPGRSGFG